MDIKEIKQQLPKDPKQWKMKEDVVYGFFFFAKKTPIDQRLPSFLKLI